MSRQYQNSPIVEALCELRFKPGADSDFTVPGLLYGQIKDKYPRKRANTNVPPMGVNQVVQLMSEDERSMVQVAPDMLVVHALNQYPGWAHLFARIKDVVGHFRAIAAPTGIQRIGLRYINHIRTQQRTIRIQDYLLATPCLPSPPIPNELRSWVQRSEVEYRHAQGLLAIQTGMAPSVGPDTATLVLDLDFFTPPELALTLDEALTWVQCGACHQWSQVPP